MCAKSIDVTFLHEGSRCIRMIWRSGNVFEVVSQGSGVDGTDKMTNVQSTSGRVDGRRYSNISRLRYGLDRIGVGGRDEILETTLIRTPCRSWLVCIVGERLCQVVAGGHGLEGDIRLVQRNVGHRHFFLGGISIR
jgi:hypothetical protein